MSEPVNPPAFPQHPSQMLGSERTWGDPGMSLRDYFAGLALTRIYASGGRYNEDGLRACAEQAYATADAMLRARAEAQS